MKKIILLVALFSLTACGNAKWSETDGTTPNTDITTPVADPVVNTPSPSAQNETLIFARHDASMTSTTVTVVAKELIEFPTSGLSVSNSSSNKSDLIVTINDQYVCTYQIKNGKYLAHESCTLKVTVESGFVIKVSGILVGQTLSMPVTTTLK